jgi:hypothetical protein
MSETMKEEYRGFAIEYRKHRRADETDSMEEVFRKHGCKSALEDIPYMRNGVVVDIVSGWKDARERKLLGYVLDGDCPMGIHFDNVHAWNMEEGMQPDMAESVAIVKYAIDCFLAGKQLFPAPPKYHVNVMNLITMDADTSAFWGGSIPV